MNPCMGACPPAAAFPLDGRRHTHRPLSAPALRPLLSAKKQVDQNEEIVLVHRSHLVAAQWFHTLQLTVYMCTLYYTGRVRGELDTRSSFAWL